MALKLSYCRLLWNYTGGQKLSMTPPPPPTLQCQKSCGNTINEKKKRTKKKLYDISKPCTLKMQENKL